MIEFTSKSFTSKIHYFYKNVLQVKFLQVKRIYK